MTTSKFRRAYSLRIPRSPKPAAFLDSTGFYDRLEEAECPEDHQDLNEISGNRDSTNISWDSPLITDAPKLNYCRKKWSSKSLRVPKTRLAETEPHVSLPEVVPERENHKSDLLQDSEIPSCCEKERQSDESQMEGVEENDGEKQRGKKMKHYKKTIDRAFRRGWGNFITNIYTISLTRTSQDAPHLVKAC